MDRKTKGAINTSKADDENETLVNKPELIDMGDTFIDIRGLIAYEKDDPMPTLLSAGIIKNLSAMMSKEYSINLYYEKGSPMHVLVDSPFAVKYATAEERDRYYSKLAARFGREKEESK